MLLLWYDNPHRRPSGGGAIIDAAALRELLDLRNEDEFVLLLLLRHRVIY